MSLYRLPNGGSTESVTDYGDAWAALGRRIEPLFPGYTVDAFDPDIRLSSENSSHTFALPTPAAFALLSAVAKIKETP